MKYREEMCVKDLDDCPAILRYRWTIIVQYHNHF